MGWAVRQVLAGGRRGIWAEGPGNGVVPFQRADGTHMTSEEIAAVTRVGVDPDFGKHRPVGVPDPASRTKGRREPTAKQAAAWEAVQRLGSMSAAAKELGIHQTAVRDRLSGYMAAAGIEGEMPGRTRQRHKFGAVYEPLEDAAHRDNGHAHDDTDAPVVEVTGPSAISRDIRRDVDAWREQLTPISAAIELTDKQAALVLEAVGAGSIVERLREHGYELSIRLRAETAA